MYKTSVLCFKESVLNWTFCQLLSEKPNCMKVSWSVWLRVHDEIDLRSVVHLERGEVYFEQAVLVVQVLDPSGHGVGLVVSPVVVLRVDRRFPNVPG